MRKPMTDKLLKNCPFCGGKANDIHLVNNKYLVRCATAFCIAGDIQPGHSEWSYAKEQAIKSWNTRSVRELREEEVAKVIEKHKWTVAKYVLDNGTMDVGKSSKDLAKIIVSRQRSER